MAISSSALGFDAFKVEVFYEPYGGIWWRDVVHSSCGDKDAVTRLTVVGNSIDILGYLSV